jgi:hypothetical protein
MDEMDPNAIDLDAELRESPEFLLLSAPVEFLGPIVQQIPQPFEIRPLRPWSARCAIRPTRIANACLKIGKNLLGDRDLKGLYTQSWIPREEKLSFAEARELTT